MTNEMTGYKEYASKRYVDEKMSCAGTQSDWNMNDQSNPTYVKNRPFYTGEAEPITVVEERTYTTVSEDDSPAGVSYEVNLEVTAGNEYVVYFNGETYNLTAVLIDDMAHCLGNVSAMNPELYEDTGEPFIFYSVPEFGVNIFVTTEPGNYLVKVDALVQNVVKLPMKYLPEGYPYFDSTTQTLIDNVTMTGFAVEGDGISLGSCEADFEFDEGCKYTVVFDGVEYNLVGSKFLLDESVACIGDQFMLLGTQTGLYPFVMLVSEGTLDVCTTSSGSEHTISITGEVRDYKKMDTRYLPDNIGNAVQYVAQSLTTAEKTQARQNIGAASVDDLKNASVAAITNARIDEICGVNIVAAEGVSF